MTFVPSSFYFGHGQVRSLSTAQSLGHEQREGHDSEGLNHKEVSSFPVLTSKVLFASVLNTHTHTRTHMTGGGVSLGLRNKKYERLNTHMLAL